jgi:hypothetical protein
VAKNRLFVGFFGTSQKNPTSVRAASVNAPRNRPWSARSGGAARAPTDADFLPSMMQ